MSTTAERLVPRDFDEYVDRNYSRISTGERCTGCFGGPAIARDVGNRYCEPCLRTMHGTEGEEEHMVRAIIGAGVAGALEAGAPIDLVHAVVQDALDEHNRQMATPRDA